MSDDILIDVFKDAKLYQLNDLVNMLRPTVVEALDVDNVCDILRMATTFEMNTLKEQCLVYFQRHKTKIFKTTAYERLKNGRQLYALGVVRNGGVAQGTDSFFVFIVACLCCLTCVHIR